MKRTILVTIVSFCSFLSIFAQETESLRDRIARKQAQQNSTVEPQLTLRAQIKNQQNSDAIQNTIWKREIYRFLDLDKGINAALYYPEIPEGKRMNLFSLIFKQLSLGSIQAYKWQLNGTEIFTEDQKENFKDILDRFDIIYTEQNGKFVIENTDIPNSEVRGYYLKEVWYFGKNNSVIDVQTEAICPILFRQDDFGEGTTRYPMFWVPYESIRPYTSQIPIMTSNLNNAERETLNDFFINHNFDGEIYKATNMRNLTLAQQYPDLKSRKVAEKKIEAELRAINDSLWVYNDSIAALKALEIQNLKGKPKDKSLKKSNIRPAKNTNASRSMRNHKRN